MEFVEAKIEQIKVYLLIPNPMDGILELCSASMASTAVGAVDSISEGLLLFFGGILGISVGS